MIQEFDVIDGVKITTKNKDSSMGCYYPEDDWSIETIREDFETATKDFYLGEYIASGIQITYTTFSRVKYITYKDERIILEETPITSEEETVIKRSFYDSPYKFEANAKLKVLSEERERKEEEERQVKRKEQDLEFKPLAIEEFVPPPPEPV